MATSYIYTWDETKPAGSRDRSLGDDDIREFKAAIRERLSEDHVFEDDETGETQIGYHRKCTLIKQGSNAAAVTDAYVLFCKNDGSKDELFGIDELGNVMQITKSGAFAVLGSDAWRSGDKLLSSNTNTPTGWTDQSATYTDNFIRISSSTPLATGGSNTHDHGGVTGSHVLTSAEIPAHTHPNVTTDGTQSATNDTVRRLFNSGYGEQTVPFGSSGSNTGGGSGHTHTMASANNIPVYVQMKMYSKT